MSSITEICNFSLSAIGQGYINDIDEKSPQAKACKLHFDSVRDSVLRQFPWNFAGQNIQLAELLETAQGWLHVYQHPANALWIRKVYEDGRINTEFPNQYEIINVRDAKCIACDIPNALAKITVRITDPALFDPLFIDVFTYELALKLAMPLTNSASKTQELQYKSQVATAKAKLAGAVEGAEKIPESNRPQSSRLYINARR